MASMGSAPSIFHAAQEAIIAANALRQQSELLKMERAENVKI
jgi:hypothetical protein